MYGLIFVQRNIDFLHCVSLLGLNCYQRYLDATVNCLSLLFSMLFRDEHFFYQIGSTETLDINRCIICFKKIRCKVKWNIWQHDKSEIIDMLNVTKLFVHINVSQDTNLSVWGPRFLKEGFTAVNFIDMYNSNIPEYLNYCIQICGMAFKCHTEQLIKIQKRHYNWSWAHND